MDGGNSSEITAQPSVPGGHRAFLWNLGAVRSTRGSWALPLFPASVRRGQTHPAPSQGFLQRASSGLLRPGEILEMGSYLKSELALWPTHRVIADLDHRSPSGLTL